MRITLLSVLGSLFARNAAKHLAINQSVAADAVTAVNAAGHFAAGIQTRNHRAFGGDHLGLGIDLDTAHRVMDARRNLNHIPRTAGRDIPLPVVFAGKFRIVLVFAGRIPRRKAVGDSLRVAPNIRGNFIGIRTMRHNAQLIIGRNVAIVIIEILIKHDIRICASLFQNRACNNITIIALVRETLAFRIKQNTAGLANALRDERCGALLDGRVRLNLIHGQ